MLNLVVPAIPSAAGKVHRRVAAFALIPGAEQWETLKL